MMSGKRYPEEFKIEAVKQATEAGYSAYDVAKRLGTTTNILYNWFRKYGPQSSNFQKVSQESDEIRRLKKDLKRVTGERDLFKKAAAYFVSHPE
jgi:transposase